MTEELLEECQRDTNQNEDNKVAPVEIIAIKGSLILRARGSELLILPNHIAELKQCKEPKPFTEYFRTNALVNRPARKLFEAWLRKDKSIWKRMYQAIQHEIDEADLPSLEEIRAPKVEEAAPVKAEKKEKAAKKEAPKKKKLLKKKLLKKKLLKKKSCY